MSEARVTELVGGRIWMATLTCSPDYLYRIVSLCEVVCRRKGYEFCAIEPEAQFSLKDRAIYLDIQKFLKRLRKGQEGHDPAHFDYLCVTEAHQSGEPHYHILIHEQYAHSPIRYRDLVAAGWLGGYAHYELVNDKPAYCCKYLLKAGGRARASKGYGSPRLPRPLDIAKRDIEPPKRGSANADPVRGPGEDRLPGERSETSSAGSDQPEA